MKYFIRKMSIPTALLLLLTILPVSIIAQSERDIKLSGNYYYGEGLRDSIRSAKLDAREDLLFKISANIISETSSITSEDEESVNSSYRQTTKLYSSLKLKGIKFYEKNMSDDRIKVLAYISLDDYRKSINDIIVTVGEGLKLAERIESEHGIGGALGLYYESYLKSYFCPEAIPYKSIIYDEEYGNVRPLLESKVRIYLTGIKLEALNPQYDALYPDLIKIPVNAVYKNSDVNHVEIRFDLPGNPLRLIEKGRVQMFLYSRPTKTIEDFETVMTVEFDDDPELEQIHKDFGIRERQHMTVDFSNIMTVDFKINPKGGGFLEFVPELGCISVARIVWLFGDGMQSDEADPIHNYKNPGEYKVVLTINNDEGLQVEKRINSDGKILADAGSPSLDEKELTGPDELINATVAYLYSAIKENGDKSIVESLTALKLSGNLMYGNQSQFKNPDNCYIIVFSTDGSAVLGFLTPAKPDRLDLLTNKKIESLSKNYRNKRAIWLEIY